MAWARLISSGAVCACCLLLMSLLGGAAQAQLVPRTDVQGLPDLRLVQVVPRLPMVHLYTSVQVEGHPRKLDAGERTALIGSNALSAKPDTGPSPIALIFLIDISASLNRQQFGLIQDAVTGWVSTGLQSNDIAAVVTFGNEVRILQDFPGKNQDPASNKQALVEKVKGLAAKDNTTLLYQGLIQAIDMSHRLDISPLRRAIVVLTDGLDDQQGGAGRQEVIDRLAMDPTPIYAIGAPARNNKQVDLALKDFAGLARSSGGDYRRAENLASVQRVYGELQDIVRNSEHLVAVCEQPACIPNGSPAVVRLEVSQPVRLSSDNVTVRLVGGEGTVPPPPKPIVVPDKLPEPPPIVEKSWWERTLDWIASAWHGVLNFFNPRRSLWPLITAGAIAVLAIAAAVIVAMSRRSRREPVDQPTTNLESTTTPDFEVPEIGLRISGTVSIPVGTRQDRQRLRLDPIGHNDIGPFEVLFENPLAVGRSPDSQICISNDGQVSANHCTLASRGKSILVQDVGSRNGTRVNGVPINGFLHAEPNSILGVGRTEMRMNLLPVGVK